MVIKNLVETHCHILPGIDDGSPDVQTSLKMIERLQAQGAEAIILTPHYYSDSISYDDFLKKRDNALNELKAALPEGSPALIPGAEVYISKYLMNYESLDGICIGSTRYALIEHPFSSSFSQGTYDRLLTLINDCNITPILAHIERYQALIDSEELLDEYLALGCLAQVNIGSFAFSRRSVRKKLIKYLATDRIQLIGSDCHNLDSRPPEYAEGVKEIIDKCGEDKLDELMKNANMLI
jgi:protein-tyrosine phosphatase